MRNKYDFKYYYLGTLLLWQFPGDSFWGDTAAYPSQIFKDFIVGFVFLVIPGIYGNEYSVTVRLLYKINSLCKSTVFDQLESNFVKSYLF